MPGPLAAIGGWLAKNAVGLLGAGGSVLANRQASDQSRRMMEFQERMSSTAAQRAVKDYQAAGLNPALAYDRPASSPGGSQAPVENVVSGGMSAKQAMANIELTKAQTEKVQADKALVDTEISTRTFTGPGEESWRDEIMAARRARIRDFGHQGRLQPHDERLRALQVALAKAGLTAADFKAESLTDLDAIRDFIKSGVSSAGAAAEAGRAWAAAGESRARGAAARTKAQAEAAARQIRDKLRRNRGGGW